MFEFGKDLRRAFSRVRESGDGGWLELISVDLLEAEARQQSIEAGRISCRDPHVAEIRAAALWREHARRSGRRDSLMRSLHAAASARRESGAGEEKTARGALEMALTLMLKADLYGGESCLTAAAVALHEAGAPTDALGARIVAAHALLSTRRARQANDDASHFEAGALLDSAIHGLEYVLPGSPDAAELRLERAMLAFENGLRRKDGRALDQAGRELRGLVADCSPDYQPLTRARALALCGGGLSRLGAMAADPCAIDQGRALLQAAADAFTPDHSPLDWTAIQVVLSESALRAGEPYEADALRQAERLVAGEGLILGALAAHARTCSEIRSAEAVGDLSALEAVGARLQRRLATQQAVQAPLDWAADQIGLSLAHLTRERLTGAAAPGNVGVALAEAGLVAREVGCLPLSDAASDLLAELRLNLCRS